MRRGLDQIVEEFLWCRFLKIYLYLHRFNSKDFYHNWEMHILDTFTDSLKKSIAIHQQNVSQCFLKCMHNFLINF